MRFRVSIIVPTFNRSNLLARTLQSLDKQQLECGIEYDVIVVDNASTDETEATVAAVARQARVPIRYVLEPKKGVAQARNRGIQESTGRWLAFIDDDEVADRRWLSELCSVARNHSVACVGGAVHLDISDEARSKLTLEQRQALRERRPSDSRPRAMTGRELPGTDNMLCDRGLIEQLGGFDVSMRNGGSDHDFGWRARKVGHVPMFAPDAIVFHHVGHERLTPEYLYRDAMQSGWLLAHFDHKYRGTGRLLANLAARLGQAVLLTLPRLAWALVRRDSAQAVSRRIRLWRAGAYTWKVLTLLAPAICSDRAVVEWLNFRRGRELFPAARPNDPENNETTAAL